MARGMTMAVAAEGVSTSTGSKGVMTRTKMAVAAEGVTNAQTALLLNARKVLHNSGWRTK